MRETGLTSDIPLGPFEGALITAYTAKGKSARLHSRENCPRLQAKDPRMLAVPLEGGVIDRMCGECARWGRWARPGTALGMFLEVFAGPGLTYELASYTGPDPDDHAADQDITNAAALLRSGEYPSSDDADEEHDDERWNAFREARELRDSRVIPEWCSAVESLLETASKVTRYPWLKAWAGKRLDLKARYTEVLRLRAARLLRGEALIAASEVSRMAPPDLPVDDPAFAGLGDTSDVRKALHGLWYDWHHRVSKGWLMPQEYSYLTDRLDERLGSRRKGRDELRQRARELLNDWSAAALTAATGKENGPDRLILATIRVGDKERDGRRTQLSHQLTSWEIGVLVMFAVAADWATRTFLLRVPRTIGERMVADGSNMICSRCEGDPGDATAYEPLLAASVEQRLEDAGNSAFLPGLLDDTPISQRRAVTLAEVRALRHALDDRRQLFVVCSMSNGVEILSLGRIEERCKDGWVGVLLAEAGDLPSALVEPKVSDLADAVDDKENDSIVSAEGEERNRTPDHLEFGEHFGFNAGERELRRLLSGRAGRRELDHNLRVLTLARGIHDLRMLDDGTDAPTSPIPLAVWSALLLTREHLDLRPFVSQDLENRWHGGLGLPLASLADVQIYTTNADPMIMGKGHSPFCQHVRDRGIGRDYFLLTLADVVSRPDLDWCNNCGGYATRRLTDEQITYYRVAHRLLDIDQALDRELEWRGQEADLAGASTGLEEISQWLRGHRGRCQVGNAWRIAEIVRELRQRVSEASRQRSGGWLADEDVVRLNRWNHYHNGHGPA